MLQEGPSLCRSRSGNAPHKVKLALNWVPEPEFGGFYAAREEAPLCQAGPRRGDSGRGRGRAGRADGGHGRADFGTAGADEVVDRAARGADVVCRVRNVQTSPQGIMVHASARARTIGDVFQSGTLAIEPGLAYAAFLKKFRLAGGEVVPYDGGVARFLADPSFAQQCYVTSEPIAAKRQGGRSARCSGGRRRLQSVRDGGHYASESSSSRSPSWCGLRGGGGRGVAHRTWPTRARQRAAGTPQRAMDAERSPRPPRRRSPSSRPRRRRARGWA